MSSLNTSFTPQTINQVTEIAEQGRTRPIVILSIITITLITILCSYILWADYRSHIMTARNNTLFISNLVAAQSRASLKGLEIMLKGMERELNTSQLDMQQPLNQNIHQYLLNLKSVYPDLMDVLILDQQAKIIQWTGKGQPPDVTDRNYAMVHFNNPKSGLFVGEPLLSKVHKDSWFFAVSLPIREKGQLQRIYVAIVDIQHYIEQFRGIRLPEDNTLGLVSQNGKIITRIPAHDDYVGQDVSSTMKQYIKNQVEGSFGVTSPLDQRERIVGYNRVLEYGITAFSTTSRASQLENWYHELQFIGILLALVIIITLSLMRSILNYQNTVLSQKQQLFTLATTDALTGIYNRRYCLELLHHETARSSRHDNPLSFLMIDIDFFKQVNDQFGHNVGDLALKQVADILRTTCRQGDIISRYGGEEFFIILPETALQAAAELAERLRDKTEKSLIDIDGKTLQLTISVGVSSFSHLSDAISLEKIIHEVDQALYQAKRDGRNRVFMSIPTQPVL